jgi:hypothetical protein
MKTIVLLCVGALAAAGRASAQDAMAPVLEGDARFWKAYNACDVAGMAAWFSEDVEFYHDRGGSTLGHAAMVEATTKLLCGNPDSRLRREAVEGSVRVFPLLSGSAVYGAVLSGEHVFYIRDKGQPDRLDGRARFTHLWLLKDGAWKMTRILSYDHGPAERPASK